MTIRVLGVHGVGNYRRERTAESWAATWAAYLREGFREGPVPDLSLTFAYYAPALHLATSQGPQDLEQLREDEVDDVWAWLIASGMPTGATAEGRVTKPIRQGIEWFARTYGLDHDVVKKLVVSFFPEVGTYFAPQHTERRQRALDIVRQALDTQQPHIVLAHSLGSVVTYEALWQEPHHDIDLLITLGSPLAMPTVVYDRLAHPRDGRPRKPPGVARWVNVADPGDFISILRPLSAHFDGVEACLEPAIHALDFHMARHYLSSPTVAALVTEFATGTGPRGIPEQPSS
ncbi:MAG TPA: hypothetical protein PLX71_10410 [Phycicoccus sp.]|nr:hypothetical protein [Phycicoccus sp.]